MKKVIYFITKALYFIMIVTYILIPLSILFFDIIDFNGEYRKLVCFITVFAFIVFYILTVELPAIIFKVPVERYDMFSKKYHNRKTLSLLLNTVIVLFLFETIIVVIVSNKIMYYDALIFLLMLFFRMALRMSSIELKSIKAKI